MRIHSPGAATATICMVVVAVTAITGCRQHPLVPTGELSAAEYDVLSAYIAGKFSDQKANATAGKGIVKVVILNVTQSDVPDLLADENGRPTPWEKTAESLRKKAPALQQTTTDAFQKVNSRKATLHRSFHPSLDYELVDSTQLNSIFGKNGGSWPAYYKQFPGSQGFLSFSRVGFSTNGMQALFYVGNQCGGLCGVGRYVVMEKRNGHWVIGNEIDIWVS